MTNEELINFGEMFLEVNKDSKNSSTYEFIDEAVKLFKQELCGDTISRKAAQVKIKSICEKYNLAYEEGESIKGSAYALGHAFDDLPPVLPQQKIGRWIRQKSPYGQAHSYECSECGRTIYTEDDDLSDFPYCHCGCKMEIHKI